MLGQDFSTQSSLLREIHSKAGMWAGKVTQVVEWWLKNSVVKVVVEHD